VGGRLWWFWYTRNHWREARAYLERLLARAGPAVPAAARADALYALGNVLRAQGELVAARSVQQACRDLRRAIGDRSGLGHSLAELGRIARGLGEYDVAVALLRQALSLQEELGEQWGVARQLNALGQLARLKGDLEGATELHQRGLAVSRAIGDTFGVSTDLASLASLAYARGQLASARALLIESLGLQRAVGSVWGMADKLELLAGMVGRLRRPHDAVLLFGAAEGLREWLGDWRGEWRPDQHERYRRDVALTRAQLGEAVFEAGLAAGRRIQLDQALDLALGLRDAGRLASSGPLRTPATLSSREREVAGLVATGLTNRQIASELVITEATAAKHVENIRAKLGVTSRTHIAAWVLNTPEPAAR
jgi:ATP/maltotriose-dependent transcriptional regulator MalT